MLVSRSAICEPISVAIAAMNTSTTSITPNTMSNVAEPRRQPRLASRLTPGSMASDRNSDTASRTKIPLSFDQKNRTASASNAPVQNTAVAGTTQRGMREAGRSGGDDIGDRVVSAVVSAPAVAVDDPTGTDPASCSSAIE